MTARAFGAFFSAFAAVEQARTWQSNLGCEVTCADCRIRIPTGYGKTLGVLAAWYYNRIERGDPTWPRRLVWTLPMRVLVEQTMHEAREALRRVGKLWEGKEDQPHVGRVGVHALMGGADAGSWHLHPDAEAVLVGTQDMLLSRALNRGYGAARGRWPLEFGLLNHDCLWVMDEIQLMDVGLATSAQLQAFRSHDAGKALRPSRTWWMSATLQPSWLVTPDTKELVAKATDVQLDAEDRKESLWQIHKSLERIDAPLDPVGLARRVADIHMAQPAGGAGRLTLLVVNTVDRATEVHAELGRLQQAPASERPRGKKKGVAAAAPAESPPLAAVDLRLVHSRFRPPERRSWREAFLNRAACAGTDRIIVSTQVVEAGVDVSANVLVTDVAPWPSLVQRFGRVARYGGAGQVHVLQVDPKKCAPYDAEELSAAWDALSQLDDVGPAALELFETDHLDRLPALYPYEPKHLLLRHELDELFDTTADLTGADIDVSRFIRTGEERDLQVAWVDLPKDARDLTEVPRPGRDALCPVAFLRAQAWLFGQKGNKLQAGKRAWVWDYVSGSWRRAERSDLYPGQVVLVSADSGGYSITRGFDASSTEPVEVVPPPDPTTIDVQQEAADAAEGAEDLSAFRWKTIATHGREVGEIAMRLGTALGLSQPLVELLGLAGRWHDVGKVHPAFSGSILGAPRRDMAKAPDAAWLSLTERYVVSAPGEPKRRRRGYRHELASALALFAVLRRHAPDHAALLGPWRDVLAACGMGVDPSAQSAAAGPLESELLALDAPAFDLLAYLVCSHHGKVRASLHAAPADQAYDPSTEERSRAQASGQVAIPIRGVLEGDRLPALELVDAAGTPSPLPELGLTLAPASAGLSNVTGASWLERVQGLLERYGPFTLAWLEAIVRAADVEASRMNTPDELLAGLVQS